MLLAGFAAPSVPEEAARFARATVAAAGPATPIQAKAWLFAASKLASFALSRGIDLEVEVVLSSSVIERFTLASEGSFSPATLRTLRPNLRSLSAAVLGPPAPRARLSRGRTKSPYDTAEIEGYLALARAQPTLARRMRTQALVCLGAGAGLLGGDLRGVRGGDVLVRSGGVVVVVGGHRPRVVPVRARFGAVLMDSARFARDRYVIGGREADRRSVTTPLVASLSGGAGLPPLDTGRLRATWLVSCAADLGLATFMHAAGICCSQRLGDLVAMLEPASEAEAVSLLGGIR